MPRRNGVGTRGSSQASQSVECGRSDMASSPVVVATQISDLAESESIDSIDDNVNNVNNYDGPRPVELDRTSNTSMMHARTGRRDDHTQHIPNPQTDIAVNTAAQLHLQREAVPPKSRKAHPENLRVIGKLQALRSLLNRKRARGEDSDALVEACRKAERRIRWKDQVVDASTTVIKEDWSPVVDLSSVQGRLEDLPPIQHRREKDDDNDGDSSMPGSISRDDSSYGSSIPSDDDNSDIDLNEMPSDSQVRAQSGSVFDSDQSMPPRDEGISKQTVKIGRVLYTPAWRRRVPKHTPIFDCRRPSIWSNPFDMQGKRSLRDEVCDAYQDWWDSQTVTAQEIATKYTLKLALGWKGDEVADSTARRDGLHSWLRVLRGGHSIALACACNDDDRCHTSTISQHLTSVTQCETCTPEEPASAPAGKEHLIVYAGDPSIKTRLAAQIIRLSPGDTVREVDLLNGPDHDLRKPELLAQLIAEIIERRYISVHVAIPCSSYAIVRGEQLRSKAEPRGITPIPPRWRNYLDKHNALTDAGLDIIDACKRNEIRWTLENPAQRGDDTTDAYWKRFEDWGFLWDLKRVQRYEEQGAVRFLLPHCYFGSDEQKYIEIMVCKDFVEEARRLFAGVKCTHAKHKSVACGVDIRGYSKAAKTAAYPTGINVLLAKLLCAGVINLKDTQGKSSKTSTSSPGQLHIGSSSPHSVAGGDQEYQRADSWARTGSLRQLEPELPSVLIGEPMPRTNVVRRTEAADPPPRPHTVPGPFTTLELIPRGVVEKVLRFGNMSANVLKRAQQGKDGWRAAKELRPDTEVFLEHEALNPCGCGFAWRRADPESPLEPTSLWEAILPSQWPDNPPDPDGQNAIDCEKFVELADKYEFTDREICSFLQHGFPGADMPNTAVLVPMHVGALKEAAAYEERNQRDIDWGFITKPTAFPTIWPAICDPCNIVVQNGAPRLTIDKTMWTSSQAELPPYNLRIDLQSKSVILGRLTLPKVWQLTRAAAIFMSLFEPEIVDQLSPGHAASNGLKDLVKLFKWDLKAFFRFHKKQTAHIRESCRVTLNGYSIDKRVNFGECDAPLNTCRASDGCCLFARCELLRLDQEYPPRIPLLLAYLDYRRKRRLAIGDPNDACSRFEWDVLFFVLFYVDDGAGTVFDDLLYNNKGEPCMELIHVKDGSTQLVHVSRALKYSQACISICEYVRHQCPFEKREGPAIDMVYLGILADLATQRRVLPKVKALSYNELLRRCKQGRRTLPNGLAVSNYGDFNSLVHKLLHASDCKPLGRQHLFYCRQALKSARQISIGGDRSMLGVIITKAVLRELDWWDAQLVNHDLTGLPLASRYSFPGASSENVLVRYSDASREIGKAICESGGGGWALIRGIFYYFAVTWTKFEVDNYSINVLEAHARDMGGFALMDKAAEIGCTITHTLAYVDNTTAEHIAESGRASTALLNALNKRRLEELMHRGIHEANERVTSVDNDVADLLSRGAVQEALRFPKDCGIECIQLDVSKYRDLPVVDPM